MGSFDFNSVKAEKAEAMRRYNRQKNFKKFLFLAEVLAFLALASWSFYTYIPVAAEVAKGFLRQPIAVFGQSLCVLILINFLILLIFVLSSRTPTEPNFYDEYHTTNSSPRSVTSAKNSPAPEETICDKQIICVDNAVNSPVKQNIVPTVSVTSCERKQKHAVSPVEKNIAPTVRVTNCERKQKHAVSPVKPTTVGAVSEWKGYKRTRSERIERGNRWELRRSETVVNREIVTISNEPARRSSAMDDLSSEEFRMEVETFIASKKKTLIRENTLDLRPERNQCVAITPSAFN